MISIWLLIRVLHDVASVATCSYEIGKGVASAGNYIVSKVKGKQPLEPEEDDDVFTIILPENGPPVVINNSLV